MADYFSDDPNRNYDLFGEEFKKIMNKKIEEFIKLNEKEIKNFIDNNETNIFLSCHKNNCDYVKKKIVTLYNLNREYERVVLDGQIIITNIKLSYDDIFNCYSVLSKKTEYEVNLIYIISESKRIILRLISEENKETIYVEISKSHYLKLFKNYEDLIEKYDVFFLPEILK